jgi:hypothetical protein
VLDGVDTHADTHPSGGDRQPRAASG